MAQVDSCPNRGRIERRFTSVRRPAEILIREQSSSCSSLQNQVILQQATAAQANLTARPLHLWLPGMEKDVLGASSCLPLRLPAHTHSLTFTHA